MKRFMVVLIASLVAVAAWAQDLQVNGAWSGRLKVEGTELRLVLHIDGDACTLDSPDQGGMGIKGELERTATGIGFSVPSIGVRYEGVCLGTMIVGTFRQNGVSIPLTLKPGVARLNRPQTPVPPFPYRTEEVSFRNGDAVLKGTLVTPPGCTRETPVLLMVTGSGLQNRDEEIFEHRPFAVIADALARQGFATLRYDDRGYGESTGELTGATTEDFEGDALAGVNLLRSRFDRVGVLGHSEGGTIALMLAAEGKVDFVVSLAGNVVSGEKTLLAQNRLALGQAGYSEEVVGLYCKELERIFDAAKAGDSAGAPAASAASAAKSSAGASSGSSGAASSGASASSESSATVSSESSVSQVSAGLPAELRQNLQAVKAQCATPYMRCTLALDLSDRLGKITCPVLALNGTKDWQVNCEENLGLLRKGLGGPKEIHAVEGVNHLFQHCETGSPSEYKGIEETFAPEALALIADWLKRLY